MNKLIIALLKPLSFLPALLIMYTIFSFSSQTGAESGNLSFKVSRKLVQVGAVVLDRDLSQEEIDMYADKYHFAVRKLAHMTEYCVLAVSLCIPLYAYGVRGIWLVLLAGLICVGFAATDEYHQAGVAGRGPSVRDVFIDSIGAFIGIFGTRIIGWTAVKSTQELEKERKYRRKMKKRRRL
ncbi:MAG: VanZ family protein [Clostridiales bacterium]|nr:VanZ family protein [Clostridiales bacterium]